MCSSSTLVSYSNNRTCDPQVIKTIRSIVKQYATYITRPDRGKVIKKAERERGGGGKEGGREREREREREGGGGGGRRRKACQGQTCSIDASKAKKLGSLRIHPSLRLTCTRLSLPSPVCQKNLASLHL